LGVDLEGVGELLVEFEAYEEGVAAEAVAVGKEVAQAALKFVLPPEADLPVAIDAAATVARQSTVQLLTEHFYTKFAGLFCCRTS
jgi:hypothetical protein